MIRIAHLTDLHFGATDDRVVSALAAELTAWQPNLVAVSGDLTMGARLSEFRAARAFLDRLGAPWLAVPGNHDISPYRLLERFTDPYRAWRREISPDTEPSWLGPGIAVFGLNTARRMGPYIDWSRGRVSGIRLRRLLARMAALPKDTRKIVVAHHPLLPPEATPGARVVGGAARALAAFTRQNVLAVLSGHLHIGYERHATETDALSPLIIQGGSATSTRLRGEPNAYNVLSLDGTSLTVERRVWTGAGWTARAAADEKVPGPENAGGRKSAA